MTDRSLCVSHYPARTARPLRHRQSTALSCTTTWVSVFALLMAQTVFAGDKKTLAPIESRLVGESAEVHLQYTDIQKTRVENSEPSSKNETKYESASESQKPASASENTQAQDPVENGDVQIPSTENLSAVEQQPQQDANSPLADVNINDTLETIPSDNIQPDMLGIRLGVSAAQLPAQATIFRDNAAILNAPNVLETVVTTTTYGVDKTESVTEIVKFDELETASSQDKADLPEILSFKNANVVNDDQPLSWETVTISKGDTLISVFQNQGIDPSHAVRIAASDERNTLNKLSVGHKIALLKSPTGSFGALRYDVSNARRFEARYHDDGNVVIDHIDLLPQDADADEKEAYGFIRSSLFEAATGVGVDPSIIYKFANIFGYEIDFAMDLRRGDRFSVIYKENDSDSKKTKGGKILAAEFINNGKRYRAIRYEDENGKANFYTPDGDSLKRAFFRSPVKFTRITSSFSNRRFHPILKKWKAHRGVDYAAPSGTPVMATAEGVISHRSAMGGYGRTVILRHENNYETVYAHLSDYGKSQRIGHRVSQGQVIGYVGQSGSATGPHLHYEFRVKGRHRNPMDVMSDEGPAERIPDQYLRDFQDTVAVFSSRLDSLDAKIAQNRADQQPDRS